MVHSNRFIAANALIALLALCAAPPFGLAHPRANAVNSRPFPPSEDDPWTPAQTVSASFLASELKQEDAPRPVIIYVGVHSLYAGGHIPGAVFHGPGSTPQGLEDLKKFAATLSKDSDVILYCGCCPLAKCPNIRPAFIALDKLGFRRLRVLLLPTSFASDWAEKGYPVEKSSTAQ